MLSRGVLNGAALNALAVNGDGIVHSASGVALMGISGIAETVRRTVAAGIDAFRMMDGLTLNTRRNAKATSSFGISSEAPFVAWLLGSSDSAIDLNSETKGIVWKVGYGSDILVLEYTVEIVLRATLQSVDTVVLNGKAFGTHRHGINASDTFNLLGSGYANTYGAIKGTGSVGLNDQTGFVRVVTGQINDIVELNDMVMATAWYSASGYGLMNLNAETLAVRWLPSTSISVIKIQGTAKAVRTLSPAAVGVWGVHGSLQATRWARATSTAQISQVGDVGVLLRQTAAALSAVLMDATANSAKRQPIAAVSLLSLIGLMPLPHVYMRPIDDCRTFKIRDEPREFTVPEEKNSMSYRCCGGTK